MHLRIAIPERAPLSAAVWESDKMSESIKDAVAAWLASFGEMAPFAVEVSTARKLLGNKSRSELYAAIGRGELDAIKDNSKTLIVTASIVRYCSRMQPAQIKSAPPRKVWPKTGAGRRKQLPQASLDAG
jgi:hypothetical protein